jgi:hypothetical protein
MLKLCPVMVAILEQYKSTHILKIMQGTFQPSLFSNGSLISDWNNIKMFFL